MTTTIEAKIEILSDFWTEYKNDVQFQPFLEYNDLGLPLAYLISADIVKTSERAEMFIDETFAMFLEATGILEDTGFDSLDDIIALSPYSSE